MADDVPVLSSGLSQLEFKEIYNRNPALQFGAAECQVL